MKISKGFTLIELLVVIAIIGILASIVLVSFPGATKKAKDSRVISAISQVRTVMAYVYARDASYAALAWTDTANNMPQLETEIIKNSADGVATLQKGAEACVYAKLNVTESGWYCADTTGKAGVTKTNDPGALNFCDGTTFICPAVSG